MVVILDEIERVFPVRGEPEEARRWIRASGALRALSQGEHRYLVVIGADLRPIANRENDLGAVGTNPFFNLFQEMPVALLTIIPARMYCVLTHCQGPERLSVPG